MQFREKLDQFFIFFWCINIDKCIFFIVNLNFGNNRAPTRYPELYKALYNLPCCLSVLQYHMNLDYHVKKAFFCPIHVAIDFLLLYLSVITRGCSERHHFLLTPFDSNFEWKERLVTVEICVLCGWWFSNQFDKVSETPYQPYSCRGVGREL